MPQLLSRPSDVLRASGRARFAVTLIFFLHGLLFANWAARLPELEQRYGLNHRDLGQVLFCHAIGAWCAMPVAGWLIQRLGSARLTTVGALLFCSLIPGMAVLHSPWQLMALFLLLGASTGLLDVAMNSQALHVETQHQRPIMSSFHAAFSFGGMLGAGAGALSARLALGLAPPLLGLSALSVLLVFGVVKSLLPDTAPAETDAAAPKTGFRWPSRAMLGLGVVAFCCMLGEGAMADWSTIYLVENAAATAALAPLGYAAFSLTMTFGRLFGDALVLRFGPRRVVALGGALAFVGLLGMLLVPRPAVGIGGLFLIGLGLAGIVPTVFSAAGRQPNMAPGVAIGLVSTIGYGGFLLGPPLIGWLADSITLRLALGVVVGLFAVLVVVALRLRFAPAAQPAGPEPH
ncbi:Fucose permease [Hymenobacter daecheongensis DSM 21074]|uniref:Fucose permease n=1 Tax=Hymenobacter daecheongensis DSM 21074 TaxID=1121955 RepID=A0A1M6I4X0_9BACT|nr:MFS transporter [Hymenobacter daecheongensis]SHJ29527.1 Fucose permease [Hymenobacter daecheongensis DSM 21074]